MRMNPSHAKGAILDSVVGLSTSGVTGPSPASAFLPQSYPRLPFSVNLISIGENKGALPTAFRTLAYHHSLIKESQYAFIPLYPFAFSDNKVRIPALACGFFFSLPLPVFPRETKDALLTSTDLAPCRDHAFKVAFPRTGMMLDG